MLNGGSNQKRFPSKKYKEWLAACPDLKAVHIGEAVHVVYVFAFPDARTRDMENYVKACSDLLVKKGVLDDDNWKVINRVTLGNVGIDRKNPKVDISIYSIDNHSFDVV